MAQSKQFQVIKQGGPYHVVDVAKPFIESDDEVLVKVKAAGLNPADWKQVDYGLFIDKWPSPLGFECSGIVEQVGSKVTSFTPGDEVLGFCGGGARKAAYQEYLIIAENMLAKKPSSMSFEEAASIPAGYLTALAGAYRNISVPVSYLPEVENPFEPKSILVLGGSSAVGSAFIQLAKNLLPDATILATSSSKHHKLLGALGAKKSFDRSASAEEIRAATPDGKGVDVIFDAVNAAAQQPRMLDAFNPSGAKLLAEVATGTNLEKAPEGIKHSISNAFEVFSVPGIFKGLTDLMAGNKYKGPIPIKVVGDGLDKIATGIDELRAGVSGTKLVVQIS